MKTNDFFLMINEIYDATYIKVKMEFNKKLKENKIEFDNELTNIKNNFFELFSSTEDALLELKLELKNMNLSKKEKIKDTVRSIIYKDRFKIFELKRENSDLNKSLIEIIDSQEILIEKYKTQSLYLKKIEKMLTPQQLHYIKNNYNDIQ